MAWISTLQPRCSALCPWRAVRALVGACLLFLAAGLARAEGVAKAPVVLIESHVKTRHKDFGKTVNRLLQILQQQQCPVLDHQTLIKRLGQRLSWSAGPQMVGDHIRTDVQQGKNHFFEGQFGRATEVFERVRTSLQKDAGTVASSQVLRQAYGEVLIFLTHSYLRQKATRKATARAQDALRSFPKLQPSLAEHAPDLIDFFDEVRRDLGRVTTKPVTVESRPPGCMVFLNERFVGISPVTIRGLFAGPYRVYLQRGDQRGRIHRLVVSDKAQLLMFDFGLDRALRGEKHVGLRFANVTARRKNETRYAATIGRALDAKAVIVVSVDKAQGRDVLTGKIVSPVHQVVLRAAQVPFTNQQLPRSFLRAMVRFLLDGQKPQPDDSLTILRAGPSEGEPLELISGHYSSQAKFSGIWKWVALGVGVGGLAGGLTLLSLDKRGTCDAPGGVACNERYRTWGPGVALTVTGSAAALAAGALFWHERRVEEDKQRTIVMPWVGKHGGGVVAKLPLY